MSKESIQMDEKLESVSITKSTLLIEQFMTFFISIFFTSIHLYENEVEVKVSTQITPSNAIFIKLDLSLHRK
jgi:hypothetical protein